jgi:hypothetical protein
MKSLLLVPLLLLTGCLSAPAQDQDRAGEQITEQKQGNSPLRMDREAAAVVRISVTMTGENAKLIYQPNSVELDGDIETGGNQAVQGATTQEGAGATQTPSAKLDAQTDLQLTK